METLKRIFNYLVLPGFVSGLSQEVRLDGVSADQHELSRALARSKQDCPVDLIFTGPLVLSKTHRLPKKARKRAGEILQLRAEALAGSSQTKLCSAFERQEAAGSEDTYLQLLARAGDVTAVQVFFAQRTWPLRAIWCEVDGAKLRILDNRSVVDRGFYRWWASACCIAIAMCGYFIVDELALMSELSVQRQAGRDQITALQNEVEQSIETANMVEEQHAIAQDTVDAIERHQFSGALLSQLTEQLPEDAWLTELAFGGGEVRISGMTTSNSIDAVARLELAPWVRDVALLRPFHTDNRTSLSNFDLLLTVELSAK